MSSIADQTGGFVLPVNTVYLSLHQGMSGFHHERRLQPNRIEEGRRMTQVNFVCL